MKTAVEPHVQTASWDETQAWNTKIGVRPLDPPGKKIVWKELWSVQYEAGPLVCDGRQQFEINIEVWNMKSEICPVFLHGQKATLGKHRSAKWEALKSNGHKLWLQVFAGIKTPKMKRDHKCSSMTTSVSWHKRLWKWSVIKSVQVQMFVGIKTLKMKRDHKCSLA